MSLTHPHSRGNEGIRRAHRRGYRVRADGTLLNPTGRRIRGFLAGSRYFRFTYREAGQCFNVLVHRLAAYQCFGEATFARGTNVRHQDDQPLDNRRQRLLLGTCRDNRLDTPAIMRSRAARQGGQKQQALSFVAVRRLWKWMRDGTPYRVIAARLKVSVACVQGVVYGRTYISLRPMDADALLQQRRRYFTWNGRTQRLAGWERELGLQHGTLWARLKRHSFEEALLMGATR
jgi:hypothetical protein